MTKPKRKGHPWKTVTVKNEEVERKTKTILVLSDIHVGSRFAISPPTFVQKDGSEYIASVTQKALYKAWTQVVNAWGNPDVLVINGEPVDGQGVKSRGVEQWTTNWSDQIKASVQLVKMFNAKKIFVTQGSGYHVDQNGVSIEEYFGRDVGAEMVEGSHVTPELYLEIEGAGITFNFAHHISSSAAGWAYLTTAIAREMMLGALMEDRKHEFQIMVRSHIHKFVGVVFGSKAGYVTPAWELQTPFMQKNGTMGSIPDIGAIRFTVHSDGFYRLDKPMLFKLPESKPPKVIV